MSFVNPILLLLGIVVAAGGLLSGSVLSDSQDSPAETTYLDMVQANVSQVDNEIKALVLEKNNNVGIGQFRADCQDSQQYISEKWLAAGRDSGMNAEDRELNAKYKDFLVESSRVINVYLAGDVPDLNVYNSLRDGILL